MRAGSPQTYRDAVDGPNTLVQRLRSLNPLVVDTVLAVALAAITLIEEATELGCPCVSTADAWWTAFFMLTQTLPLALRRRYPFTVLNFVGISAIVYDILAVPPDPYTAIFAVLLAFYTVAAYARRDLAIASLVIVAVVVAVLTFTPLLDDQSFQEHVTQLVLFGAAWFAGDNLRHRRREAELLRERADRAEREREEQARLAAMEERGRIAREIHDVVTHSVSVIAVQAGAARTVLEDRPERALEALQSIERVSRETLAELRGALGVLRSSDGDAALAPQPGLDRLEDLVGHFRQAGLTVEVTAEGTRQALAAGLDLAAYRVVQEALTNALRHAGPTVAHVAVTCAPEWLEVLVTDEGGASGSGNASDRPSSGGQGLVGMRERVEAYGGTLQAGPANGGFTVRARFPLPAEGAEAT